MVSTEILRLATKNLLETSGGCQVVAAVGSWREASGRCFSSQPDVILIATERPPEGVQAARELIHRIPNAKIVMLFGDDDQSAITTAVLLGVRGIISQSASLDDLQTALRSVAGGETYLDGVPVPASTHHATLSEISLPKLSPREVRVLRLVVEGKSSKEIATALNLRVETVHFYRKSIMRKLKVHNVASLIQVALHHGLIQLARGSGNALAWTGLGRRPPF